METNGKQVMSQSSERASQEKKKTGGEKDIRKKNSERKTAVVRERESSIKNGER